MCVFFGDKLSRIIQDKRERESTLLAVPTPIPVTPSAPCAEDWPNTKAWLDFGVKSRAVASTSMNVPWQKWRRLDDDRHMDLDR